MKVDKNLLIKAVNSLNASKVIEKEIDVTQETDKLAGEFIEIVKAIPDEKERQIPDEVITLYNHLVNQKPVTTTSKKEVAKKTKTKKEKSKVMSKKPVEKKNAVKKEVKAPAKKEATKKANKVSNASKIDALLIKGGNTFEQIAKSVGGKISSVRNHVQDLRKKGKTVNNVEGKLSMK
jgi:hypothetical protein